MRQTEGILIFFDEERRREVIKFRKDIGFDSFSDALSVLDLEIGRSGVAALAFSENTLDFLSLITRGKQVVTSKSRVEFSDLIDLQSIPFDVIAARLNTDVRRFFVRSSRGRGGRIPGKTWQELLEVIKEIRPKIADDIDRLGTLGRFSGFHLTGQAADILLQQREAFGTSLDIFSGSNKLRKKVLGGWAPPTENIHDIDEERAQGKLVVSERKGLNFLSGIPSRFIQEESALQHDLTNWPGMKAAVMAGWCSFTQGERRLDVVYANKNDLEHTLGVDLIYYNEAYSSFVLVQQKLMKKEDSDSKFIYRPDAQLKKEVQRMVDFAQRYQNTYTLRDHEGYRLNRDGFFVKLVPNRGLRPASGELIEGMYLPRDYIQFLLCDDGPKGPRNGKIITFENSPRYLTNTEFSQFVERGWIGTSGSQSSELEDLIATFLTTGKSLVFAREILLSDAAEEEPLEDIEEPQENGDGDGEQSVLIL